jgi:hypothetical protein
MVEITDELLAYLRVFQKEFGDIVPLRELPVSVTTEELIEAIKISIEKKENVLPSKFGFEELEKNPDILI